MRGIIYCYTSPSNKKYIGQTKHEEDRKRDFLNINCNYSSGNCKIDRARKKYSPENFIYEILEEIIEEDQIILYNKLNDLEVFYIKKYNTIKNGYNASSGGRVHSRLLSKEERIAKSKKAKAKFNGKTPEYLLPYIEKSKKQILQYSLTGDFIKEWDSVSSIIKEFGKIDISSCCTGKRIKGKGYIWRYKESDNYPLKIDIVLAESDKNWLRRVIQYDASGHIVQTFKNSREMRDILFPNENIKLRNMWGCLSGKSKTYHGFILKFEDIPWPLMK